MAKKVASTKRPARKSKATDSSVKTANRSDVIREIIKSQPDATIKAIRAELEARGVEASDALINKIKYGRKSNGKSSGSKRHGTKAEAIRAAFDELGADARPRDVIATLASRGVKVTPAQVSTLRKSLPQGSSKARGAANGSHVHAVSLEHLLAAKQLAERLGGIEVARQALTYLAKLTER